MGTGGDVSPTRRTVLANLGKDWNSIIFLFFKNRERERRECVHVGRDEWAVCFREMDSE